MNFIEYNFALFKKDPPPEPSKFDKVLGAVGDMARQRGEIENNVLASGDRKLIKEYYKERSLANKAKKLGKTYKSLRRNLMGTTTWDRLHYGLRSQRDKSRDKLKERRWNDKFLLKTNRELVKQLKKQGM